MMWETNRHMDKETNRQMDRKTHWHMDKKQTDRYIINKQQGLTLYSTIYLKQWNIILLMLQFLFNILHKCNLSCLNRFFLVL